MRNLQKGGPIVDEGREGENGPLRGDGRAMGSGRQGGGRARLRGSQTPPGPRGPAENCAAPGTGFGLTRPVDRPPAGSTTLRSAKSGWALERQ